MFYSHHTQLTKNPPRQSKGQGFFYYASGPKKRPRSRLTIKSKLTYNKKYFFQMGNNNNNKQTSSTSYKTKIGYTRSPTG